MKFHIVNVNERDLKESEPNFPPLTTFGTFLLIYPGVKYSLGVLMGLNQEGKRLRQIPIS
jgi:hypothetical protein